MQPVEFSDDVIVSKSDLNSDAAIKYQAFWKSTKEEYDRILTQIKLGGGLANIEKQHKKGRLTARERIKLLIDDNTPFFELGAFTGYEMYEEWGGCPAGGTISGVGEINGKKCMIIANDATVKAGAFFPMTAKKVIRSQKIALENEVAL